MKIIRTNKQWIVKKTAEITSGVYSVLAMIAIWVDFTSLLSSASLLARIGISLGLLILISAIVFFLCYLYLKNKESFLIYTTETGHKISICFGDILNFKNDKKGDDLCSYVIPVNRCFDTIVDDKLIAHSSLHGKFIDKLIRENQFSPETLNARIQESLANIQHEVLQHREKPSGNLCRYPEGTTVKLNDGNRQYFLLGLSSFNQDLRASTSKEEYTTAIQKLIEFCDSNAQGGSVYMPIIGTGLSRVGVGKNSALQFLYHTIILNKKYLSFDITIVIPEAERGMISLTKF